MNTSREASASDVTRSEESARTASDSTSYPPDPSATFLERKARMRAEASPQTSSSYTGEGGRGFYRGDTSSGAFRPLNYGGGK